MRRPRHHGDRCAAPCCWQATQLLVFAAVRSHHADPGAVFTIDLPNR